MPTRSSGNSSRGANALVRHLVPGCILLYLLLSLVYFGFLERAGFTTLREAGYGDSYILRDILSFEKTGIIYHSRTVPPYTPVLYSPFVYIVFSISRYFQFSNLFAGPRLIAFALFLASLGMAASIVRKLVPIRFAWIWGILLTISNRNIDAWVLALRSDFAGIFFGLASMRLLISRYRHAALAAGLCAGMTVQIKLTMMAAPLAGFLWLLLRRRWRDAGLFAAGVVITSLGLFSAWWLREPNMISQMTSLSTGIWDVGGCVTEIIRTLSEPVVLISLLGLPFVTSRLWPVSRQLPGWTLMFLYVCCSAGLGFLADLQVGGNMNYFFEALYGLTPFAVLGIVRLFSWSRQRTAVALFAAGVIVFRFIIPDAMDAYRHREETSAAAIAKDNRMLTNFQAALSGQHIFSVDPRIALFDPNPPLTEPYLVSYMRAMGRYDATPLIARIAAGEFDVFVSEENPREWRGIHHFGSRDPEQGVISAAYKPYCVLSGDIVRLPAASRPGDGVLKDKLRAIGCASVAAPSK